MPKPKAPRHGSMQVWPRKRANRPYAHVRRFNHSHDGVLGFAGYKMGMTHVMALDTYKNSMTKNETIFIPATVLECPPLKIFSVRAYTHDNYGYKVAKDVVVLKDRHVERKTSQKAHGHEHLDKIDPAQYDDFTVIVATQPSMTGIGQKKAQLFELEIGGKTATDKLTFIKTLVGKDIRASDLFKVGEYVDAHAITTGKGYQGPVKRFGIGLKGHKSEKGRRRPASLGGWSEQQHVMYRVAYAGQMGYHQRVQYNNQILKITDNPEEIQTKGGFIHYGVGRKGNEFLMVRGSVPGPKKRLITLVKAIRLKKAKTVPAVEYVSLESQQGK